MSEQAEKQMPDTGLSPEFRQVLEEESFEAEIKAIIDAAREIGLIKYSREDAIRSLLQEQIHKND